MRYVNTTTTLPWYRAVSSSQQSHLLLHLKYNNNPHKHIYTVITFYPSYTSSQFYILNSSSSSSSYTTDTQQLYY